MSPTIIFTTPKGVLLAALILLSTATTLRANESIVLPAKGEACKTIRSEGEFSLWQCHGPAGYGFSYADAVTQGGLKFGLQNRLDKPAPQDINWAPANDGIGSRVEWRTVDGKPYAAIIGRWRRIDDADPATVVEELLVAKVSPAGSCEVASVGAFAYDPMTIARTLADSMAPAFKCGTDKPVAQSDVANAAVNTRDTRFGPPETLDHNGSLVELRRLPDGTLEIRYQQPRPGLPVSPGTLLFRGQVRQGQLSGMAFVFKQGCEPAGYQVSGKRQDGVLVLEGAAPHRDPRSCAILSSHSVSKHSTLVFNREPIVEDSKTAGLERLSIAQCGKCMPATVTKIENIGTAHAHLDAEITRDNVREYCENWTDGSDRLPACLAENAAEIGKAQQAEANCADLTVNPSSGGRYKFVEVAEDAAERLPVWKDITTNNVECNANACNGRTATAHFTLLCPAAVRGWSGFHY